MARRERGLLRMIFWNFVNSLKPRTTKCVLVGEDYYGTKYFEAQPSAASTRTKSIRYFEPLTKDDHAQELPAEWEAWLRYRRRNPPTREEIEESYRIAMMKKENALKIEATYSKTESKQLEVPAPKQGFYTFPQYPEYENFGQNYDVKRKK